MSEPLDSNLYEKKRIILSQHRMQMERYKHELAVSKHNHPIVSKHEYARFSKIISEAVLSQQKVQITLYGKNQNEFVVGIPVIQGNLRVLTDEGTLVIQMDRVIDIRVI